MQGCPLVVAQSTVVHRDPGPTQALQDLLPKITFLHHGEDDLVSSASRRGKEERRRKRGGDPFTETGHQNVGLRVHRGVVLCVERLLLVAGGKTKCRTMRRLYNGDDFNFYVWRQGLRSKTGHLSQVHKLKVTGYKFFSLIGRTKTRFIRRFGQKHIR